MADSKQKRSLDLHDAALEIFGGLAQTYERTLDIATLAQDRYWKRWVCESAGLKRGERVLDVGCGTCLLEKQLDRYGCSVVGVDLTERMIRLGASKSIPSVEGLIQGDAESLPFPDGVFDVVISCYVVKYVDIARFAKEASRVLKSGGRVVLYDFVRPRGPYSPLLKLYIEVALPIVGRLLTIAGSEAATTFRNLPRIIDETAWDGRTEEAFEGEGVSARTFGALSHGVVWAYSGSKAPSLVSV